MNILGDRCHDDRSDSRGDNRPVYTPYKTHLSTGYCGYVVLEIFIGHIVCCTDRILSIRLITSLYRVVQHYAVFRKLRH